MKTEGTEIEIVLFTHLVTDLLLWGLLAVVVINVEKTGD